MKIQKILIAVDDSKISENAASYGFELAHCYKAHVGLVNIVEPIAYTPTESDGIIGMPFIPNTADDAELIRVQSASSENIIQRTIKTFAKGLLVTQFTDYGSTAEGILSCSKEFGADLIVLGTHSRTGIDRLLMGSIAEDVVRHAEVPVMVVPLRESESQ
ncbi:MAG: universal stress protein [Sphingobacteriales bacterium]